MSIFEAEVRHRAGDEDVLTSRIFGALSIVDKRTVLAPFLTDLGLSLAEEEIPSLSVSLWNAYGDTEPDVIIESSAQLVFIEVKLGSSASCEQLEREYKHGRKAKDKFSLFLVTRDFREPEAVGEALGALSAHFPDAKITWIRWQQIYAILKEIAQREDVDTVSRNLVNDLLSLLSAKGLRGTVGIKEKWLQEVMASQKSLSLLCDEIGIFIQELNYRAGEEGLKPVTPGGTSSNIDRDGRGSSLGDPSNWFPKYFEFAYKDESWAVTQFFHRHLYVRFYLGRSEVHVGFIIIASSGKAQQDILRKQPILFERLKEYRDIEVALIPLYVSKANDEVVTEDAHTPFEVDKLKRFQWLDLRYKLPITALEDQAGVIKVLDHLIKMRNLVNEVQLFPEPSEVSEAEPGVEDEPQMLDPTVGGQT